MFAEAVFDPACGTQEEEILAWSVTAGAPIVTNGLEVTIYSEDKYKVGTHMATLTRTINYTDTEDKPQTITAKAFINVLVKDPCETTKLMAVREPLDMKVEVGKGQSATQWVSLYNDEVTESRRDQDNLQGCGTLEYKVVDSSGETPDFILMKIDPKVGIMQLVANSTSANDYGVHPLSLEVSMKEYPEVAPLTSNFRVAFVRASPLT